MATSRKNLSSQVSWLFAGGAIGQITALVLNILLARMLGQVAFGTYRQLFLLHGLLAPLFSIALPASTLYFLAREDTVEGRKRFMTQTVLLLALLATIASGVMFMCAGLFSRSFSNPTLYKYTRIFAIYTLFMLPTGFLSPTMVAIGKARVSAIYSILAAAIKLLAVLVAASVGGIGAVTVALVGSSLLDLVLALWLARRFLGFVSVTEIRLSEYRVQLSYAVPLGFAAIVSSWGIQIDQFLVATFFRPETYAIYVVGAIEVPLVRLLQSNINSVTLPEITRLYEIGDRKGIIELWRTAIDRTALITFPLFVLLMLIGNDLILLLFSDTYQASVEIFRIYLLMIPLRLIMFGMLLRASGKTRYDLWGSCIALVVNVTVGLLLLKLIGITGPAWSTVLSLLSLVLYLLIVTAKELRFTLSELIPLRILGKHVAIGASVFFIVYSINAVCLNVFVQRAPILRLLITCTLFGIFYILIMLIVSPMDLRIILRKLRSWIAHMRVSHNSSGRK